MSGVSFNLLKSWQKQRKVALIYTLLALVTLGLYWPVSGFEFINFDDNQYVTANPNVQAGFTIQGILWAFSTHHASNWHPLTWMSHMLDCQFYGLHAGGHHLTSVLFHVVNTLLLFGLLRQMTGALWRSAFVAALFAWHPLHVESVAWVSERKDVLSTFFALLTICSYWLYFKTPNWWRYGLTMLFYICGLMSKPMLVTLPLLLLLLDYWPLERNKSLQKSHDKKAKQTTLNVWMRLVKEKVPFFILSGVSCCVTYWVQVIQRDQGGRTFGFGYRVANALNSYATYIWKTLWPHNLSVFYPYPHHLPPMQVIGAGMFLIILSALAFHYRRSRPNLIVGWLWFLIALVPVIGLVQVGEQAMADRYTYIPAIGLFVAIAWEIPRLLGTMIYARQFLGMAAALVLGGCLIVTSHQLRYWENSITLFTHAIEVTQNNALAHCNLAVALLVQGKTEAALVHLDEALKITPNFASARNARGELFFKEGRFTEAAADLNTALAVRANFDVAHDNLGKVMLAMGKPIEAESQFRTAVRCDPDSITDHINLGLFLEQQGRLDEAVAQYTAALRLTPSFEAENALGSALEKQGKITLAVEHYKRVVSIKPDSAEAECNLGSILAGQGKLAEAVDCLATAIKIKPDFAEAHFNLGNVLISQKKLNEAAMQYAEAVRFKPDYMAAYFNLGNVLFQQREWSEALTNYSVCAQLQPNFIEAQIRMAMTLRHLRNGQEAINHYRVALDLNNQSATALQGLAWTLATDPDPKVRNGKEAISYALLAAQADGADPIVWDTLAAAYAEIGSFNQAVKAADKAIDLATNGRYQQLAGEIQNRRQMYLLGKVFRDSP
jgi:tetratricopeptide (TPR) repeat protein